MASTTSSSSSTATGAGSSASANTNEDNCYYVILNRTFHPELQPLVEQAIQNYNENNNNNNNNNIQYKYLFRPDFDLSADPPQIYAKVGALLVHGHFPVGENLLAKFPNLLVVSNHGVGIDHIDVEACTKRGIACGHTPDVLTGATADMAFALLLAIARNVVEGDRISRDPLTTSFNPFWFGREVHGASLGIVGMGRIGQEVAKRGYGGFGMKIVYHNRRRIDAAIEQSLGGAIYCPTIADLLSQSDFVVIAAPASAETRHMFSTKEFDAMKANTYLVNISRGTLIDQDALIQALNTYKVNGKLAAAGLDVTDPEPLPRDHPLFKCANCTITPHTGSATFQTRRGMLLMALENLTRGLDSMPAVVAAAAVANKKQQEGGEKEGKGITMLACQNKKEVELFHETKKI